MILQLILRENKCDKEMHRYMLSTKTGELFSIQRGVFGQYEYCPIRRARCIPYRSYAMAVTLEDEGYPAGLTYDMYDPHKTGLEENTEQYFLQLEAQIRKYFKVREIAYHWSSQYFEPADGLPYIGHLPGHPGNIYVATGFGGNGMVYSSVAALLLKRMILALPSPLEQLFDPNRIKPIAGFGNFISHNSDVIKQFFSKFFTGEKLSLLADLGQEKPIL